MNERLLIIKWGALGDVVISTPHIEAILAAHPEAQADLLTAPAFAPLFAGHPRLSVATFPRQGAMWSALRWVRRQHFDAVYDLQGNERSALLTRLSGARRRVGLASRWIYTDNLPDDDLGAHIFERLNRLLARAGVAPAAPAPRLWPTAGTGREIDAWLCAHALAGKRLVLMHAGSSQRWLSKRWEEESFIELARALGAGGFAVIWVGGSDERELNARLAASAGVDATNAFSIPGLALLATRASFAITCDSGPMHVISSAGIPVYSFFGPTDWHRHHAVGQQARVLSHPVECSPCYLGQCPPERKHACLASISAAAVLARLRADALL